MIRSTRIALALTTCSLLAGCSLFVRADPPPTSASVSVSSSTAASTGGSYAVASSDPVASEPVTPVGVAATPVANDQPIAASALRLVGSPRMRIPGMTFRPAACQAGAAESCNGIDDNCDGAIDEGCGGVVPGDIQVALAWDQNAEIYLTVHSAEGGHRLSATENDAQYGGTFQRPRRQRCVFGQASDRLESGSWRARSPSQPLPRGTYRVSYRFYSTCNNDRMPAPNLVLSVSVGGRTIGSFHWSAPVTDPFHLPEGDVLEFDVQ